MTTSTSASLYITQIRFCRALAVVRSLPIESGGMFQPSTLDKLNFYGLYKQALVGDCMLLKPSQKNIVQYAKWKAWDKLRGVSPIDAQIMYIEALVNLLKKFIQEYPSSNLIESMKESVQYLEEEASNQKEENLVKWDTNDQEKEEFYLGRIELSEMQQNYHYYSSPVITPELTPRSFQNRKKSLSSSTSSFTKHYHDSTDDECDKEVASIVNKKHHLMKRTTNNNAAIKTLQLEVQALCEEIDELRRKDIIKTSSTLKWLFKSIARHAFFNFLILLLVFIVLWRRKSPIAFAIIGNTGPKFKGFLRVLFNHTVFWKVTV